MNMKKITYYLYTADNRPVAGYGATVEGIDDKECHQKALKALNPIDGEYIATN